MARVIHHHQTSQLLSRPGVWLIATRAGLKLRDGIEKTDPMRKLSKAEPTWFERRTAAEFMHDRDVIVLADMEPPKAEEPASSAAKPTPATKGAKG